ncbi:MAG: anaerobic sulfatase maturase [Desulfobacterales bacterium]|nr:anaerobic sulfatase maturase [Desulfobacterales bacterium]
MSLLVKPTSWRCNLDCTYCFYKRVADAYPTAPYMNRATLAAVIRTALESGADQISFCWQGGEPTLLGVDFFRAAVALQQRYARPGQQVENSFQTNGILLDEDWLRFFAQNRFLVGVSLDGPAEIHDACRRDKSGRGTFDRVMGAIDGMQTHGVDFNILTLVHDQNVTAADRLYDFLRGQGFTHMQFTPCFEAPDPAAGPVDGPALGDFYCQLFDRWYADGFARVSVRLFADILMYLVDGAAPSCCWQTECRSYLVVEHNGDCYPCDFYVYPEWRLGNLVQDGLAAIADSDLRRAFSARKAQMPPACRQCAWFGFCRGDCTRFRQDAAGQPAGTSRFCKAWSRLLEHIQPVHREMRERAVNLRQAVLSGRFAATGRNQPCPCGSGKKFKKCCGREELVL